MSNKLLATIQFTAFVVMILANALANILPINNLTTGAVSNLYNNYFVPAGFTFSIWAVIYSLLLVYCIYSVIILFSNKPSFITIQLAYWFAITCLLNSIWIFLWHYLQIAATVWVMLALLLLLIKINAILSTNSNRFSIIEKWCIQTPFIIYLGWISVATIANIAALLTAKQWNGGWSLPMYWSCIMIVIATFLALFFLHVKQQPLYAMVIAWALWGIANNQSTIESIVYTAYTALVIIILLLLINWVQYFKSRYV